MTIASKDEKFLPFLRSDRYGEAAAKPQPTSENLRLLLSSVTVLPLKTISCIVCIIGCFICTRLAGFFPEPLGSKLVVMAGRFWSRLCLAAVGFRSIQWVKVEPQRKSKNAPGKVVGIVSNHTSHCDILLHMHRFFPSFVARDGTQNLPMIGYVSLRMQCMFVDRDARRNGQTGVAEQVKARMLRLATQPSSTDRPMLLFPEGTTSNGKYIMPFKTGAFLAGIPLQPVIIQYHSSSVSPAWESVGITKHLYLLFCNLFHSVTCYELPPYFPSEQERGDPALYAANVRQYMLKYSKLQATDATMEDKRRYQEVLKSSLMSAADPGKRPKQT